MDSTEEQVITRLVSSLYERRYGEPDRTAEYKASDGRRVLVYKWRESRTGEGVAMYRTAGSATILRNGNHGCEFFLGLTPEVDDVVEALAEVATTGAGRTSPPLSGDTVTLSFPLWKGTSMRSLLFTDGTELTPRYSDSTHQIDFIQLVPLFESELRYKKSNGEAALWRKFEEQQVPYWSSVRNAASI